MHLIASSGLRAIPKGRRAVLGVSLIEVMIAIVLSAVGLLALAGVNAASIRYTKMSQYRGTASLLASDIADRMRANKAAVLNCTAPSTCYKFKATDFVTQKSSMTSGLTAPASLCGVGATCTKEQIAEFDLYDWRQRVWGQLPEGAVFIGIPDAGVLNGVDVFVIWRDPAVAATDEAPAAVKECPDGLTLAGDLSVRCAFLRVQL